MSGESNTKISMDQGGDRMRVDGAGGAEITPADGTQASAIADHGTPASATNEEIATKQNAILAALRGVGIIASS